MKTRLHTRRYARFAEIHPVQPLKGLRATRVDTVFYRAFVPAGHGGCGMSPSNRALVPDGAIVSAAHLFPLRSLARHCHSAANAVSERNLQFKLVRLRGRRRLRILVCLWGRRHLRLSLCVCEDADTSNGSPCAEKNKKVQSASISLSRKL